MAQEQKEQKANDHPEWTLGLIKPDAYRAGKADEICARIEKEGFRIVDKKLYNLTKERAEGFYAEHKERGFFADLVKFMTSGSIIALKLEKEDAIKSWRALMGPTNAEAAKKENPQCLRALYGTNVQENATHGSDSVESAKRELDYFFPRLAVGFLSPRAYMTQALKNMNDRYDVHVLEPNGWEQPEMDKWIKYCKDNKIVGVCGYSQKDAFHHLLLNEGIGNVIPARKAFLYCMNKHLMRTLEKDAFWYDSVDPNNEDFATIAGKIKEYPFMLKNTSLSLGRGIFSIDDEKKLKTVLDEYMTDKALQENIAYQMSIFSKGMKKEDIPPLPPFISEHKVDINDTIEYCYEGFITPDGKLVHYALTEEVYFQNHQALGYLTPPMSLKASEIGIIEKWVSEYMQGYIDLGYKNQFFNLELWLTNKKDQIFLTEINPRAAHSFHYNYLYSFGTRLFEDNMELARGADMTLISQENPWTRWIGGTYKYNYTLIVLLTAKQTGKVCDIFDYDYVKQLESEGILIRHNRKSEDTLTEKDMTSAGCMVMQLWVTGKDAETMIGREIEIRNKIYKIKQPGADYPSYWNVKK